MITDEDIAFPGLETMLIGWLPAELASFGYVNVQASTLVPNPRPDRWVRVVRTGGPADLVIDRAQITFEAWGTTTAAASDLAGIVRVVIRSLRGRTLDGHPIYRVAEFGGPALLPDPDTGQARYSWTVQIPVRGYAI